MFVVFYYLFDKLCCWINFGGFGMMGFGLFVVLGVKMVLLEEIVVCVIGDGSI